MCLTYKGYLLFVVLTRHSSSITHSLDLKFSRYLEVNYLHLGLSESYVAELRENLRSNECVIEEE